MMILDHKVTVYVPSTANVSEPDPEAQVVWRDTVQAALAAWFGGATADHPSLGAFVTSGGALVKESIVKVYAFTDAQGLEERREALFRLVRAMAVAMGQESVAVEIDGAMHFVEQAA